MSAETIIKRIKTDATTTASEIRKNAEQQAKEIKRNATADAKKNAEQIISEGKQQAENRKKILISQARQEAKRKEIEAKNDVIEDCFTQAIEHLNTLNEETYHDIVKTLIEQGKKRMSSKCTVLTSKDQDKHIAKELDLMVSGSIDASGGVILTSEDGTITIDNTFEGIIKRKKAQIREHVGKLLFSDMKQ